MLSAADAEPLTAEEATALLSPILTDPSIRSLVLAVSGGPDSVALMQSFAWAADRLRAEGRETPLLSVASVDHALRQEADAEARQVIAEAARLGFDGAVLTWQGAKPKTGLQEAARAARYRLLADYARRIGAGHIVTAHTLDDQAETVLLRLAGGSGPAGLAAMRSRTKRGDLVLLRPFLGLPKARLLASCAAQGWSFVSDPANTATRFARARLRKAQGVLAEEGLNAARLARLALRMQRVEDALSRQAEAAISRLDWRENAESLSFLQAGFLLEPQEIRLRLLERALRHLKPDAPHPVSLERLERFEAALYAALTGEKRFRRSIGGALVERQGERIALAPEPQRRRGRGAIGRGVVKPYDQACLGNSPRQP